MCALNLWQCEWQPAKTQRHKFVVAVIVVGQFFLSSFRTIAHNFMNSICSAIVDTCKFQRNFTRLIFNWYQSLLLRAKPVSNLEKPLVGEFRYYDSSIIIPYRRDASSIRDCTYFLFFVSICIKIMIANVSS